MNEWGFAAEIKSTWDDAIASHPEWGLNGCRVEQRVADSLKRSDLYLDGGGPVLCGELRLPDHPEASAWHPDNLSDAVHKATSSGCRWAFTSDGVSLLLIDTELTGTPLSRVVQKFDLIDFENRTALDSLVFLEEAKAAWREVLEEVLPVVLELIVPPGMAPDELFINALRALLSAPVAAIRDDINLRRQDDSYFEQKFIVWMVEEQGWSHSPARWEPEIRRAAQLTAYVFTTRLMFYEALRRANPELSAITIPEASARIVAKSVEAYFTEAMQVSGDYQTLFAWDPACEFALMADGAVPGWRRVVDHLEHFDISSINYDVLGKLFERLIDPHERYRWGQHYTHADVVDLMLSLALPAGRGQILDPAAGGGTFLVRAYERKRWAEPEKSHQELLSEIYGVDISAFAASLSTVNLAVRSLNFVDNYPQVAAKSFFRVDPATAFMALPAPEGIALDGGETRPVSIARVDAVVCNPPYVRIHELSRDVLNEASRVLGRRGNTTTPAKLHGLSNYHVYFWLHASQFLDRNGRLVFIAAGDWLDSDYGAELQLWLLQHFAIECFIESGAEPWFSEARVGTVVCSARLEPDEEKRVTNDVRFVMLRSTLRDLFGHSGSVEEHLSAVDRLRDQILALTGAGETVDMDWSVVSQARLMELGQTEVAGSS